MKDRLIFKSFGRTIFDKKVNGSKGLEEAIEELRRKIF